MYDIELSCVEFTEKLASKSATPGGGGAAALAGALAAALCRMVGNLTIGKKKYAAVEEEIKMLMDQMTVIQNELLMLVAKDAEAFEPLSKAYGLPKDSEEEKVYKAEVMEKCLYDACMVPVQIMEQCCKVISFVGQFAKKGSVLAVSDAACAASLAKSALQCASLNVWINTKSMQNREKAKRINEYCSEMLEAYEQDAQKVYQQVSDQLKTEH